jgi:hypothetical protein
VSEVPDLVEREGEYRSLSQSIARAHAFEGMSPEEIEARQEWLVGADLDDSPFCECGACHSIEEEDSNQCDCCGRLVA